MHWTSQVMIYPDVFLCIQYIIIYCAQQSAIHPACELWGHINLPRSWIDVH